MDTSKSEVAARRAAGMGIEAATSAAATLIAVAERLRFGDGVGMPSAILYLVVIYATCYSRRILSEPALGRYITHTSFDSSGRSQHTSPATLTLTLLRQRQPPGVSTSELGRCRRLISKPGWAALIITIQKLLEPSGRFGEDVRHNLLASRLISTLCLLDAKQTQPDQHSRAISPGKSREEKKVPPRSVRNFAFLETVYMLHNTGMVHKRSQQM